MAPGCRTLRNSVKAGEWVVSKAKELGLINAAMETYGTFGRSWELQKYYAAMIEPQYMPIVGYPKAWTPGTNGGLRGPALLLTPKTLADLDQYKGKLKDAIVLLQGEQDLPISFEPGASRLLDPDLQKLTLAPEPGGRRAGAPPMQDMIARQQLQQAINKFLKAEGARRHPRARPRQGRHGLRLERRSRTKGRKCPSRRSPSRPSSTIGSSASSRRRSRSFSRSRSRPDSRPTTAGREYRCRASRRGQEAQIGDRHARRSL